MTKQRVAAIRPTMTRWNLLFGRSGEFQSRSEVPDTNKLRRGTPAIGHTPVRRTAIRRTVCKHAQGAAVLPSSNHPAHGYPAHGYPRL